MNEYLIHIAEAGERWDQIAFKYYGNPKMYETIIRANPYTPIWPAVPEGTRLKIPVRDIEEIKTDTLGGQPPWR